MSGMQMMMVGSKGIILPHSVGTSPTSMGGNVSNGASYSEGCSAVVVNGIGPFTFLWSFVSNDGFSLVNATSQTCSVQQGPNSDTTRAFTIKCDVTDTGNSSTVVSSPNVNGSVTWGTPP